MVARANLDCSSCLRSLSSPESRSFVSVKLSGPCSLQSSSLDCRSKRQAVTDFPFWPHTP